MITEEHPPVLKTKPPLGSVAVIAMVAAVVLSASALGQPGTARLTGRPVDIQGATLVCPDLRQSSNGIASRASVGVAPLAAGGKQVSGVIVQHVNSKPLVLSKVPLTAPGQVAVGLGTDLRDDALVLRSSGGLSGGLEAEQVTRGERQRDRGLAGLRCDAPHPEEWFSGGSSSLQDITKLVLVNVDDTPSTVDVTVFSASGPADPRLGQGITVSPHSRTVINMDTLAPDRSLLAVHVHSRQGRVAAAMLASTELRDVPLGVDWVPQSAPPATSVLVPGVPQLDNGVRLILVTNPGADDTVVSLQMIATDSQFVPTGMDQIPVPAGTTVAVQVNAVARQSALGVRVVSSGEPVLAAAYVLDQQSGSPAHDFGYTAGSLPLSGPALLTDLVIDKPTESTLIFTAPDAAATVRVKLIRVLGTQGALPADKVVRIPAGRTVTLKLSTFYRPGTNVKLAVEVLPDPGSGPVYAARYLREHGAHGPLTTLLNLQGPALSVLRPVAAEDPRTSY